MDSKREIYNLIPQQYYPKTDFIKEKIPFEEAWKMVEDGLITDAISVAAFQKVKWML